MHCRSIAIAILGASLVATSWLVADRALAHCDSMDGPIIPEALRALDGGDVAPVLKWVRPQDEPAIRDAFDRTRAVRGRADDVREVADRLFLETLIRIHREGEGEPFTGLKPAGSAPPIFRAADEALATGSVDDLAAELSAAVERAVRERFELVLERRERVDESVETGRAYVEAYVGYVHFVEGLHDALESASHHPAAHAEAQAEHD